MKRSLQRARSGGFTLIEIAVVLVIIGLLTAGIAALFTTFLKTTRSRVAADNAAIVQQSLQRFVERYGRLPCPAVPTLAPGVAGYGSEDAAGCPAVAVGVTQMARGVPPWITLGLPADQVQDGYARMFTYQVTIPATQTNATTVGATRGNMTVHSGTPVAGGLATVGNQINSCWMAAGAPPAGENSCNMNAVVVLISHGENGAGAFTTQGGQLPAPTSAGELENLDANVAFVKGEPNATGFDDLVFAWSPDDIFDPLSRQGTIKSGAATANDTVRNAAVAVSNAMVNGVLAPNAYAVPAVSPIALPSDPWASPVALLDYITPTVPIVVAGSQLCGLPAGAVVFTIRSRGVDQVQGLNANTNRNDDVTVSVTVDLLRAQVNNRPGFVC